MVSRKKVLALTAVPDPAADHKNDVVPQKGNVRHAPDEVADRVELGPDWCAGEKRESAEAVLYLDDLPFIDFWCADSKGRVLPLFNNGIIQDEFSIFKNFKVI